MSLRKIMACLLAASLTAGAVAARPRTTPQPQDTQLTPEEEREATELVEEFNRKFVETGDIGPLIKDYFVPDFEARLGPSAETFPFFLVDWKGWKDKDAPPDAEDMRRLYSASTNFLHAYFPLYAAAATRCAEAEDEEGDDRARPEECDEDYDPKPAHLLPPAAVEILRGDALLREAWLDEAAPDTPTDESAAGATPPAPASAGGEGSEVQSAPGKDDEALVRDAAELRRITKLLDEAGRALRKHLAAHPVSFGKKEDGEEDDESKEGQFHKYDPKNVSVNGHARVLAKEFYGYPEGTRLVCANVGGLHVEMVRADDGRLRILSVYLLTDD